MNLKKVKLISIIGIFILAFILHFVYKLLPCSLNAIFFPVNESIWEHQKLIFSSVIIYGIIDYLVLNKFKIKYNNFFTSLFVPAFTIIPIFLVMYMPLYYRFGPKFIINILVMLVTIIISQIISYHILRAKHNNLLNKVSILLIILCYIGFAYLTYYPPKCQAFLDAKEEKYGINNYNI